MTYMMWMPFKTFGSRKGLPQLHSTGTTPFGVETQCRRRRERCAHIFKHSHLANISSATRAQERVKIYAATKLMNGPKGVI
eukprot:366028-Chlamydomonas_euryale.AAC.24